MNNNQSPERVERVYVPVSVKDRMPKEDDNRYFVILENGEHNVSFPIYELNKFPRGITHWLEEKPLSDLLPKAGGVDLKAMEERFNLVFDTETVESFELWLKEKRFKEPAGKQPKVQDPREYAKAVVKSREQPGKPESWQEEFVRDFQIIFEGGLGDVVSYFDKRVVQPLQEELKERAVEIESLQEETENRIRALQKQLNKERDEALRLSARKDTEIATLRDENIKLQRSAENVKATFRETS